MRKSKLPSVEIVTMPMWKSRILNSVAWLIGIRGENVYCITINYDLNRMLNEK